MDDRTKLQAALERYRDGPPCHERSYPDLHEHVLALAREGLLQLVDEPINKDTEMHPLVRWQYRGRIAEPDRKAFLFTQPTDSKGRRFYAAVLVAGLAANRAVYRTGFGKPLEEIGAAWVNAIANPIAPRVVANAPCQEIVITGADLDHDGQALDGLPVPISTPGWDNAPYLSAGHYITKDPDTGIQTVGNYRGQLKAPRDEPIGRAARRHLCALGKMQGARRAPALRRRGRLSTGRLLCLGAEAGEQPRRARRRGRHRRRSDQCRAMQDGRSSRPRGI
jgi:3-polyprenyl-4-hydroxybenzoate decarboxylase